MGWKYYIVYTVWIAFEFVYLYFFVIETKGKNGPLPLEEIAQLFDGEEARDAVVARTNAQMEGTPEPIIEDKKDLAESEHVEHILPKV